MISNSDNNMNDMWNWCTTMECLLLWNEWNDYYIKIGLLQLET